MNGHLEQDFFHILESLRVWEPSLDHVHNIDGLHNTCWLASTRQTYPEILLLPSDMIKKRKEEGMEDVTCSS